MKQFFSYFLILLFTIGACTEEISTDAALVEADRTKLNEEIYSEKILMYKLMKLSIQSSSVDDPTNKKLSEFQKKFGGMSGALLSGKQEFSVSETLTLFNDYQEMKEFIKSQDENEFPTLMESILISSDVMKKDELSSGPEKVEAHNREHAALAGLALLAGLGTDICLYECHKTDVSRLEKGEQQSMFLFFRSFLYLEKKYYYLSEADLNQNIAWLEKNPKARFELTTTIFGDACKQKDLQKHFLSLNYLLRGLDRLCMDDKNKHEQALKDFESFIKINHEIGIENELLHVLEAYVYIEQGKNDKAIESLKKLQTSHHLNSEEKDLIGKAITLLEKHKEGEMNKLIDASFIGSLSSKNLYRSFSSTNSKEFLKKSKVKNPNQVMKILHDSEALMKGIKEKSGVKAIKETGSKIEKAADDLFDKVKSSFD